MSVFEAGMLICFGVSWPVSIIKALRTKEVVGKSPLFMAIISLGYLSGIVHKVLYALDWIVLLYVLNLSMVLTDLILYYHYLPAEKNIWTTLTNRLRGRS
jgi:hypothetical protein